MSKKWESKDLDPKNTLIVDSLNFAFRWKHAGNDFDMPEGFLKAIKSLAKSYECGRILVLGDGGSDYRRNIHPEYKSTRRKRALEATEQEKRDSARFFEYYEQTLDDCRKEGIPVLKYPGVEADDLAAYIVEQKYALDINDVWLITSDADWDLLIEEDVSRFSTVTRKEVTWFNWPHPVPPEKYIELKVLTGDKGDDVPGVDGIGPKRAAGLIEKYHSVFDLIEHLPLPGKAKYIQNLNASGDLMLKGYELMDLRTYCEEAIGEHLENFKQDLNEIYEANL